MTGTRIGVFDSGIGGLFILDALRERLPQYSYIYLADQKRMPYGIRTSEEVELFAWNAVQALHKQGCDLIITACNTVSARALRKIQQSKLPELSQTLRVLGVIRPTVEYVLRHSKNKAVALLATPLTVKSKIYEEEFERFSHEPFSVFTHPCQGWAAHIEKAIFENVEIYTPKMATDVASFIGQCPDIDLVVTACTHYEAIHHQISSTLPPTIRLESQGHIVAQALEDYLARHPEIESRLQRKTHCEAYTTGDLAMFRKQVHGILHTPCTCFGMNLDE